MSDKDSTDIKTTNPPEPVGGAPIVRANQVYRAYLNALYSFEYFTADQNETLSWSRRWDYIIGLSSAISGGAGVGSFKNPSLAWICGVITIASLILTVAKATFDWPGRLKFDTEHVNDYAVLAYDCQYLKEDLELRRTWDDDLEKRFLDVRKRQRSIKPNPYKRLSETKRRLIQDSIKARYNYKGWWLWT